MTSGLVDHIKELAEPLGGIRVKKMFGGWGLFTDERMFGLVAEDVLYLKVDAEAAPAFDAEGLEPFAYDRSDGRAVITSYRRAPERVFDDPDEFRAWIGAAIAAAARFAVRPPKTRRKPR